MKSGSGKLARRYGAFAFVVCIVTLWACPPTGGAGRGDPEAQRARTDEAASASRSATADEGDDDVRRRSMVERQIVARGIRSEAVLDAIGSVPRHEFVPEALRAQAYSDHPLPIGEGQTISQPYIVALMTELSDPGADKRVLEVGTGSGYQAAVLAKVFDEVYSVEILPELARQSERLLERLGYSNVEVRIGDGYDGWPEAAPFDAIVVTAAPDTIPPPLLEQLAVGGRLVIPVGRDSQDLVVVTRLEEGFKREIVTPVRFVPMTGKAREGR